eukprot:TRINITY_DN8492_c0_g2_i1.p1 TRINITY_DN8492_c0_g2~~TRINITY_DN8492_c0_g2_i1.p1  ORF type:complete len:379 (+),score=78.27 TRINITY_DN8492_c0_g2_i1:47-1183(+)
MSVNRRTLWIGDLDPLYSDEDIRNLFPGYQIDNIKVGRDKNNPNAVYNYAFLDFANELMATRALEQFQFSNYPGSSRRMRLDWAISSQGESTYAIFVGDLCTDVTDQVLKREFACYFSCTTAKVVTDPFTGESKGYGFVKFSTFHDMNRALTEKQGIQLGTSRIRLSAAVYKHKDASGFDGDEPMLPPEIDPNNTTIYIGGLVGKVDDVEFHRLLLAYGNVDSIRMLPEKACAIVKFQERAAAESFMNNLQGRYALGYKVKVGWGRFPVIRSIGSQPPPLQAPEGAKLKKPEKEGFQSTTPAPLPPDATTMYHQMIFFQEYLAQYEPNKDLLSNPFIYAVDTEDLNHEYINDQMTHYSEPSFVLARPTLEEDVDADFL